MRVEVLDREEIEEKMLMTPGDIVMMLNEMGGMRVQTTSPSLGAASVRIQGMRGRYTRFLSDGLPLFGEVGGLGLLQIPPMDLGQVEVIKGVASALYGAGAMGGVVNLMSRRPGAEPAARVPAQPVHPWCNRRRHVVSPRSLGARLERFAARRRPLAGDERRQRRWMGRSAGLRARRRPPACVLGRRRRPHRSSRRRASPTRIARRHAGWRRARRPPAQPYVEALETRRYDGGAVGQFLSQDRYVRHRARGAGAAAPRSSVRRSPRTRSPRHGVWRNGHPWNRRPTHVGRPAFAVERDAYRPRDVPRFDYDFLVPGVFVQDDVDRVSDGSRCPASARLDHHNEYGTFFSPRVRRSSARGVDEPALGGDRFLRADAADRGNRSRRSDASRDSATARAERGRSASFDLSRTDGPLSYTATLFASRVSDPLHVERSPAYVLSTLPDPATNAGLELLGTWRRRHSRSPPPTPTFARARPSTPSSRMCL